MWADSLPSEPPGEPKNVGVSLQKKKKIDKIQRNTVMQEIRDNYIFVFFKLCRKQTAK